MRHLFALVLATRNEHKVDELRPLLEGVAEVLSLQDFPGMPEVLETGTTFEENAAKKAEAVARYTGNAALADDSGLEVVALGGAPGVHSARFAGVGATDAANRALLLRTLAGVPAERRDARFVCVAALAVPGRPLWTARGVHEGRILDAPRGRGGFGYDPLFYSEELGATFAEVPAELKNQVSHRARALAQLRAYLLSARC